MLEFEQPSMRLLRVEEILGQEACREVGHIGVQVIFDV